ncbi:hypothetical protein [Leucobacter japonicus]|uniref:hypothetical protein n=1 Tax=Leucobacter japonicus TaxID=1461259 RepID=UPI0012E2037D|nr:hypothetical protein [Leucobacter japonicus]
MRAVKGGQVELVQITQVGKIVRTEGDADMTDRRNAMTIGGMAVDKATKLLDRDSGLDGANSTLDALEAAVGAAARLLLDDGQTSE